MTTAVPSPETLTRLVSSVTETMFGLSFSLESGLQIPWDEETPWRAALLPIPGKRPVTVVIASDPAGAALLGSAMFACAPADVDPTMVDDSLTELVNIVAGQVKSTMGLDQALGLPQVVAELPGQAVWQSATMRSGRTEVHVWVAVLGESFEKLAE